VVIWHRSKLVADGLRAWVPRIVHPLVYLTNGEEVMRIINVDGGRIRTCEDEKKWDYNMPSAEFRERVAKAHARVRDKEPAFKPDPRIQVQH